LQGANASDREGKAEHNAWRGHVRSFHSSVMACGSKPEYLQSALPPKLSNECGQATFAQTKKCAK